jgi:hypothetical protein
MPVNSRFRFFLTHNVAPLGKPNFVLCWACQLRIQFDVEASVEATTWNSSCIGVLPLPLYFRRGMGCRKSSTLPRCNRLLALRAVLSGIYSNTTARHKEYSIADPVYHLSLVYIQLLRCNKTVRTAHQCSLFSFSVHSVTIDLGP